MINREDIERIIAEKEYWQKERAESWDAFTRHMEMGELREYKQQCIDEDIIIDALKEYLHYKDLQEAGRLVELPCAVGETVWVTVEACDGGEFCPYNGGFGTPRCDKRLCKPFVQPLSFESFMLGEEFYLTREEAEAALKGGDLNE